MSKHNLMIDGELPEGAPIVPDRGDPLPSRGELEVILTNLENLVTNHRADARQNWQSIDRQFSNLERAVQAIRERCRPSAAEQEAQMRAQAERIAQMTQRYDLHETTVSNDVAQSVRAEPFVVHDAPDDVPTERLTRLESLARRSVSVTPIPPAPPPIRTWTLGELVEACDEASNDALIYISYRERLGRISELRRYADCAALLIDGQEGLKLGILRRLIRNPAEAVKPVRLVDEHLMSARAYRLVSVMHSHIILEPERWGQ